jgi:hypothetical protein
MKRFITMLTLAAIMTALMGMSALPARADITNGSCDYTVDDECGGGGGYSAPIVTPISPPDPGDAAGCYDFCMTLPGASGPFCTASCSGGDVTVNTPNGPQQPIRPL